MSRKRREKITAEKKGMTANSKQNTGQDGTPETAY